MMISNKLLNSSFKNLLINNNSFKILTSFKLNKYSTLNENDDFSIISTKTTSDILNNQNDLPLLINRKLKYPEMFNPKITPPKEAWIEDFTNNISQKLAIVKLHPTIFGHFPRTDMVRKNLDWQKDIHWVNFLSVKVRNELPDSTKKPWPQKGSGRARHGSKRSPQWIHGGWVKGPRGPMTKYRNLHYFVRVRGLCSVLSAKFAQNDLKIIKDLESFESDNPKDLVNALEERRWGPSCLFVDTLDIFPKNISLASHPIDHINLMPVYGLNVHSMLKHETLILTMNALNEIENKLLLAFNRIDLRDVATKHEPSKLLPDETPEFEGVRWVQNLHKDDWI